MLRRAEERLHRPCAGGYDRFEGEQAYRQLAELYRAVRLYVNGFQPSMKLRTKHREGSKVSRTYHDARTPLQRLVASAALPKDTQDRLVALFQALDPVRLLHQLHALQDALWQHGSCPRVRRAQMHATPSSAPGPLVERQKRLFDAQDCGLLPAPADTATVPNAAIPPRHSLLRAQAWVRCWQGGMSKRNIGAAKHSSLATGARALTPSRRSGRTSVSAWRRHRNARPRPSSWSCSRSIPAAIRMGNCERCNGASKSGAPTPFCSSTTAGSRRSCSPHCSQQR